MASLVHWRDSHVLAMRAARHFGLRFTRLEPMTDLRARMYGDCCPKGVIRLRVHQLHRRNRPLAWSTVKRYLAHELAHTHPEGWKHGKRHRELQREILAYWRGEPRNGV